MDERAIEVAAILLALLATYVLGLHVGSNYPKKRVMREILDEEVDPTPSRVDRPEVSPAEDDEIFDRVTPITAPGVRRVGTPTDELDGEAIRRIVRESEKK